MTDDIYTALCQALAQRPGRYQGSDIPEFYALARELFTPEKAAVCAAQPRGLQSAHDIAQAMGKDETEVATILESMAQKGLCFSINKSDQALHAPLSLIPGMFEYHFMRGTTTNHDHRIARLVREFKEAYDRSQGIPPEAFPSLHVSSR